jgi:hypothetical protein
MRCIKYLLILLFVVVTFIFLLIIVPDISDIGVGQTDYHRCRVA